MWLAFRSRQLFQLDFETRCLDSVRDHPGMPFGFPPEYAFSFAGIPIIVTRLVRQQRQVDLEGL
jgi:hypothetical protein